ncbi:MAG TPA: AglZ/HisF2 family acetamidino modification protein [Gemmatimonadaceae bacterium]|nr:AglZ/HisF2 family acetamidino modification protein [Gemmatimonadaceae bacterium]
MLRPRITPCLLVQNGGLVKTVQFKDPRYIGDPINAVKIFNEKETDELIVLDIDATAHRTEPNFRLIAQFAVECRMPLCYGGGIKTPAQAKRIIGLGVEKIAISSAAMADPEVITAIAQEIGSQSVVVVLDAKQGRLGSDYEVRTGNGAIRTGKTPVQAAKEAEARGAGEIVVNSIDNDGMMRGYDLTLATQVRNATQLPMTVLGGAGSLADMSKLIAACGVIGAAAGSFFVFKGPLRGVLISYPNVAQKEEVIRAAERS